MGNNLIIVFQIYHSNKINPDDYIRNNIEILVLGKESKTFLIK